MKRPLVNFVQSLAAVLVGNSAYFLLMGFLPPTARHVPFQIDLGLAVDAIFCLAALVVIKVISPKRTSLATEDTEDHRGI
jgi:hypothetical protein